MIRFYWYCENCYQRGNKLFEERKEAKRRASLHRCPTRANFAKVRSTKSSSLPIHPGPFSGRVTKEMFKD